MTIRSLRLDGLACHWRDGGTVRLRSEVFDATHRVWVGRLTCDVCEQAYLDTADAPRLVQGSLFSAPDVAGRAARR